MFDKDKTNEELQLLMKIQNEYNIYKSQTIDVPSNTNLSFQKLNKNISKTIEDSAIPEEIYKKRRTVVIKANKGIKDISKDGNPDGLDLSSSQEVNNFSLDKKGGKVKSPKKVSISKTNSISSPSRTSLGKSPLLQRRQNTNVKINEVSYDSSKSEHSHNETEKKPEENKNETLFHTSDENIALLNKVSQLAKHKKMSMALGKSESIVNFLAKEDKKKTDKVIKLHYNYSNKSTRLERKETNMTKDFETLKEKYNVKKQVVIDSDEHLMDEMKKKKMLYLYNINQDINYHMQKPTLTDEEKKRYEEFKEKLDSMNKFASEDYVHFFDNNFHDIKEEMEVRNKLINSI
jgi:hypothetical protein